MQDIQGRQTADTQPDRTPPLARHALVPLFWAEVILFWREPFGLFFTLFFPVLLLLLFGTLFGLQEIGGGYRVIDVYVPGLLAMVIANVGLMGLPMTIANYREEGILKRYQVSPLPLWALIGVHMAVNAAMFLVSAVLVIGIGAAVFRIPLGANYAGLIVAAAVSLFAVFTGGLALASVTSSVRTVQAVGSTLFFVLFFTSGLTAPRNEFPPWLRTFADNQPLARIVDMFSGLWLNAPLRDFWQTLLLLLAFGIGATLLVRRSFRWQP